MTGPGCDAPPGLAGVYVVGFDGFGAPIMGCRCVVCPRCGRHTGNATQGHFWSWCGESGAFEVPHLCCPGDCELDPS